ncbi:MAG: hypothetical protein ACRCXA_10115 [Peptostreptococcaceae bacterium]
MKLKRKVIVGIISAIIIPFIVGLAVNFTYDKIKNHSDANKSGFKFEFKMEFELK